MKPAAALLAEAAARLKAAGIEDARREARLLLAHALSIEAGRLFSHPETPVPDDSEARFAALVSRRAGREPLSHLTGTREFWSLSFAVGPAVLDPRPDTETLVALVLDHLKPRRILDLGTGSGAILLALLHGLPEATGLGVDRSADALRIAEGNAASLGLSGRAVFRLSDWGNAVTERFDLVVSNPPYIPTAEIPTLAPEVAAHEPRAALDGGADGLDAYRAIAAGLDRLLDPGGHAAFEVGAGQAPAVTLILETAGFRLVEARADLGGHVRALLVCRSGTK